MNIIDTDKLNIFKKNFKSIMTTNDTETKPFYINETQAIVLLKLLAEDSFIKDVNITTKYYDRFVVLFLNSTLTIRKYHIVFFVNYIKINNISIRLDDSRISKFVQKYLKLESDKNMTHVLNEKTKSRLLEELKVLYINNKRLDDRVNKTCYNNITTIDAIGLINLIDVGDLMYDGILFTDKYIDIYIDPIYYRISFYNNYIYVNNISINLNDSLVSKFVNNCLKSKMENNMTTHFTEQLADTWNKAVLNNNELKESLYNELRNGYEVNKPLDMIFVNLVESLFKNDTNYNISYSSKDSVLTITKNIDPNVLAYFKLNRVPHNVLIYVSKNSSLVDKVLYDNGNLYITFKTNHKHVYKYNNVTKELFIKFISSDSLGKFYNNNIRDIFNSEKVNIE